MNEEQLAVLWPYVYQHTYTAGQHLVHQGDDIDWIFFVLDGGLKATRVTIAGQQVLVRLLVSGDSFPATGMVEGGEHPATVQAAEPTRVARVRRTDLLRIVTERGDLALQLIRELGSHISHLDERVSDLSLLSLQDRIVTLLLRLTHSSGSPAGRQRAVVRLTHAEIASLIGGCRETVTRVLAEFRRWGWVGVEHGNLVVLNPMALAAHLNHGCK